MFKIKHNIAIYLQPNKIIFIPLIIYTEPRWWHLYKIRKLTLTIRKVGWYWFGYERLNKTGKCFKTSHSCHNTSVNYYYYFFFWFHPFIYFYLHYFLHSYITYTKTVNTQFDRFNKTLSWECRQSLATLLNLHSFRILGKHSIRICSS